MRTKLTKYFVTIMFVLLSAVVLQPTKAEAAVTFEDIPVYVVDDMRDYDQRIGLSWRIDWNLDREAGVTEECRYAKFSLKEDSFVRIKMAVVDMKNFFAKNYFRLYGNETMAVPLMDKNMEYGEGDGYFLLKAGTYYIQCGSELRGSYDKSNHSTRVMIGAVPEEKAVEVTQTASADRKKMTVTVTQKFATELPWAKWREGKLASGAYFSFSQKLDNTNSFTVDKNGWYTVRLDTQTYDSNVEYNIYINVTGIGEGAKKGITYKSNNLKYKLVKEGFDGTGTVMVTGIVKQKSSVTIPQTVKINGHSYKVVKINSKAFYKKSKVKKVTVKSTYITSIGKNAFKGIHKKAVFKVPKSKYKAYKSMLTPKTGFAKKTMKIKK